MKNERWQSSQFTRIIGFGVAPALLVGAVIVPDIQLKKELVALALLSGTADIGFLSIDKKVNTSQKRNVAQS